MWDLIEYLKRDSPFGDITSRIIPEDLKCKAFIISKDSGVVAGLEEVKELFEHFGLEFNQKFKDGNYIKENDVLAEIYGNARKILLIERTALNILSRMSGIATKTRRIMEKVKKINKKVKIAATRKTCPSFSYFEKKAVEIGGGETHRFSISDMILIKDNHIKLLGLEKAVKNAKKYSTFRKIEVEVENLEDAIKAAKLGVDIIMLDNMMPDEIENVLEELKKHKLRDKVLVEVSGGINEENIYDYAKLDVDIISMGDLTENARSLDFTLEIK